MKALDFIRASLQQTSRDWTIEPQGHNEMGVDYSISSLYEKCRKREVEDFGYINPKGYHNSKAISTAKHNRSN